MTVSTSSKSAVKAKLAFTPGGSRLTTSSAPPVGPVAPTFSDKVVRKKGEIVITKAQFTKTMRATASAEEKIKMMEAACSGAKTKLEKIDYAKLSQDDCNEDQFDKIVDMGKFLSNMKQHFIKHDMGHWFFFFPQLKRSAKSDPNNESNRADDGKTVNLFDRWNQIGAKKDTLIPIIAETVGWIQMYTNELSTAFLEDLEWTHKYLMDSMSPELALSVQTTLDDKFDEYQQGGPLTFAVMLDKAVNLSQSSILNIQTSIKKYNVSNVPGEDIELIARRLRHVYRSLETNDNLGLDLINHLLTLFQTSSVCQFNELFQQWDNDIICGKEDLPSYHDILDKASDYYETLCSRRVWHVAETQGSVFKAVEHEDSGNSLPGEKVDTEKKSNRDKNPWLQRPLESMKVNSNPLQYEKTIGGGKVMWCDKCNKRKGKWTKSHYTDTHTGGKPQATAFVAEGDEQDDGANPAPTKLDFKTQLMKDAGTRDDQE